MNKHSSCSGRATSKRHGGVPGPKYPCGALDWFRNPHSDGSALLVAPKQSLGGRTPNSAFNSSGYTSGYIRVYPAIEPIMHNKKCRRRPCPWHLHTGVASRPRQSAMVNEWNSCAFVSTSFVTRQVAPFRTPHSEIRIGMVPHWNGSEVRTRMNNRLYTYEYGYLRIFSAQVRGPRSAVIHRSAILAAVMDQTAIGSASHTPAGLPRRLAAPERSAGGSVTVQREGGPALRLVASTCPPKPWRRWKPREDGSRGERRRITAKNFNQIKPN
jgi:hypothetical protein